jgi:hypothetical protein
MRFNLENIYHGCPQELQEEMNNLFNPCFSFVLFSNLQQNDSPIKITTNSLKAKESLSEALISFISIINGHYDPKNDRKSLALQLKLLDDLGEIQKVLNNSDMVKSVSLRQEIFPVYINMMDNLTNIFNLVIYQPISLVNQQNVKKLDEYFKKIFHLTMYNCIIIANSIRSEGNKSSNLKNGFSKSSLSLLEEFDRLNSQENSKKENTKKKFVSGDDEIDDDDGEDLGEDDEEEEEEEKHIKKRGRPRK